MISIGPQRIHHSPFAPLTARPAPRSQPSNKSPHPATSLDQQQSAGAEAMSHQTGRNNGRRSNGSVSARTMDGGACPPRFERTVREERRQSGSGMQTMQQHQHREGGGGNSAEPRNTEQKSRSLATPPAVLDGGSAAAALSENGRESRSSVSESSGSGRRQPQPPQRQQYSTRRWTKGAGGSSGGSGPNSPRQPGGRPGRRRQTRPNDQQMAVGEPSNNQNSQRRHLPLTSTTLADPTTDQQPISKSEPPAGSTSSDGWTRRKRPSTGKQNRGNRTMSSIDSGKGEDLSSSRESSVFDPQTPSQVVVESMGERSPCSSCSSGMDDEFHDALSHQASDDDGINSSAFVTPSSTPPHSPIPQDDPRLPHPSSTSSILTNEVCLAEKLRRELELLSEEQQKSHDQQYKSHDQHQKSRDERKESHDQYLNISLDRHQKPHEKHPKSRDQPQKSRDKSSESGDSQVTKPSKNSRRQKKRVDLPTSEGQPLPTADGMKNKTISANAGVNVGSEMTGVPEKDDLLIVERVSEGPRGGEVRRGGGREEKDLTEAEVSREAADTHVSRSTECVEECDFPSSVIMSSVGEESYSGSDASPQSSVCSNSSHPLTPPICSSHSHSPSPSTPSQRNSPSPSLHVTTETVATDTGVTTEMRENAQEWPLLEPVKTNSNEDEWPDLHSPGVKIQPTEFFTNSGPNGEVKVQHLEPHPQNAAAAYPHMIHVTPYPMGWSPHFVPHVHVPVTTTGPFNYYHFHHPQHQTGFTGYYPPPPHGPAFSWSGSHVGLPPVPVPYTHSGSEDDSGCVDLSKTPPTSPGEEDDGQLNVEIREIKLEDGEEDRFGEGEKEGERGGGGEVEEVKDDGDLDEVVSGEGVEDGEGEEGEDTGEAVAERDLSCDVSPDDITAVPSNLPLESTWVMWYDRISGNSRNCRSDYRSSLQNIHTMSSVEDFWRLYNNIRQPRGLERNSNYHFFKEGIEPLWEDPANEQGGKWVLTLRDEAILDKVWEELLLAMIGGVIESSHAVNGAVVSRRKKGDRVALWTSKKSAKINLDICVDLLRVLAIACEVTTDDLPDFVHQLAEGHGGLSLEYMYHRDALRSGTSYQNSGHIHLKDNCQSLVAKVLKKLT